MSESTTMIAWMKAVVSSVDKVDRKVDNVELNLGKKIDLGNSVLHEQHNLLREEFVIHKTKINTRTAMISAIIAAVFTLASLGLTLWQNSKNHIPKPVETNYELVEKQS
jgi:hypothetical protein